MTEQTTTPESTDAHAMDHEPTAMERAVWHEIQTLGIACERMACDPQLADTAAFCAHYGIALADSANAIVVASKKSPKKYAACLLLADSRLDVNRAVCQLLEVKRASFASAEETRQLTGQMIGGVTVFGWPERVPLYVDARVMTRERIVVGGGSRRAKFLMAPSELHKLPHMAVVDNLAAPRP